MYRKYRIVNNTEELEQAGRAYGGWMWFEHYIPRDYKEHEYPAFIEWEDPWDAHEHGKPGRDRYPQLRFCNWFRRDLRCRAEGSQC